MTTGERAAAALFREHAGVPPDSIEAFPASGSARQYFRLRQGARNVVATYNADARENLAFVDFSRRLGAKGVRVPAIHAVASDGLAYLQEDLGDATLLDAAGPAGDALSSDAMALYRQALRELLILQVRGHEGIDYSRCLSRADFDGTCARWDLDYYKYCFLRLSGIGFDEERLEEDFKRLAARVDGERRESFMHRDFQSRNIMVRDDSLFFVDYQGGRRGAFPYDVASLLHDAAATISPGQREELMEYYVSLLSRENPAAAARFRSVYDHFVLLRLLQAMGAFGLRGLHEGKRSFMAWIRPGSRLILSLFALSRIDYPEIEHTARAAWMKYNEMKE